MHDKSAVIKNVPISSNSIGAEFMLSEYERLSALVLDENRQAEQRINFFLGIASGLIGAVVLITQFSAVNSQAASIAIIGLLTMLILVGINIQNRLTLMSVQHATYVEIMFHIQDYFAARDVEIAQYLSALRYEFARRSQKPPIVRFIANRLRGSLNDLMALVNATLCGGIGLVVSLSQGYSLSIVIWYTVATATLSGALLYLLSRLVRKLVQ